MNLHAHDLDISLKVARESNRQVIGLESLSDELSSRWTLKREGELGLSLNSPNNPGHVEKDETEERRLADYKLIIKL